MTRKRREGIRIGGNVDVFLKGVRPGKFSLAIIAPKDVEISRIDENGDEQSTNSSRKLAP